MVACRQLNAVAVLGPTASGKTALGLALAAKGLPIEIISLDSALVYKDMDIGTAKPTPAELVSVPHHLIDIITPEEVFNASDFVQDCLELIDDINARGHVPVILGGTMMYYKALVSGLDDMPDRDPAIRARIEAEATEEGWPAMHARLAEVDPATAERLKPNDSQRIERALEVYQISGKPLSFFHQRGSSIKHSLPTMALIPEDRSLLHARIEKRFVDMLDAGLVDELLQLRRNYCLTADMPSMRCVGYRQVWEFVDELVDQSRMIDKGVAATRQLAKRQLTWLRSIDDKRVFDPFAPGWENHAVEWVLQTLKSLDA